MRDRLKRRSGFTLVELLTVIAITAILLGIILVPLVQSLNIAQSAAGFAEAQNRARIILANISREIGNSVVVRDNAGEAGALVIRVPARPGTVTANPDGHVPVLLNNVKLDIVIPAEGEPPLPGQGFVDPGTGKVDPTLRRPKGQVVLPVAPGQTLVRYFVGLNRPLRNVEGQLVNNLYQNPYDGLLMPRGSQRDNLFVLFRAEVQPYRLDNDTSSPTFGRYIVNVDFFEPVFDPNFPGDLERATPLYDDPWFFVIRPDEPDPVAKANRIRNWRLASVVQTEISRYDMIMPVFDRRTREVAPAFSLDGVNNAPRIMPLVQFTPQGVNNQPATSAQRFRLGDETDNMDSISVDIFSTQLGGWSSALTRIYPANFNPQLADPFVPHQPGQPYLFGRFVAGADSGYKLFRIDPALGQNESNPGVEVFDITRYENSVASGNRFPFVDGLAPLFRPGGGSSADERDSVVALFSNPQKGRMTVSFGIDEYPTNPGRADNWPAVASGPAVPPTVGPQPPVDLNTPPQDRFGGFNFRTSSINERYNETWQRVPEFRGYLHRFIDLRVVWNAPGVPGPLHPDPSIGFSRARIVPGSEVVIGPDQRPGPNYGSPIRYTRTTQVPGVNQYRINYVDLREPSVTNGGIDEIDYRLIDPRFPQNPGAYNENDFLSAVIQPRFKAGYVQLNSDPNNPIPAGEIVVFYRFQFTRPNDVFAVDYDTRQVMNVQLTIRNYPQTTLPNPQTITLTSANAVRNFSR
jgi:prepilin-type N-terminal cleavage/methylation domain-containing protein